ncbi:MAG: 3-phosphoshikimate 1-carboxyvinyltransferase [Nitrospinota bacterium]|nr:3-phosphoshikimate 1-carboxyvinyltransferase [Nitrospinota bacterium]MDH5678964.1 3-phosphoshikimate 1-carboxyvinyltransferase [Nitrospinota bacterium]
MKFIVTPSPLGGSITAPASKSHTIRAVFIAALAQGRSVILNPLDSADGRSALCAVAGMGADVEVSPGKWTIDGVGGHIQAPACPVDVGNSGTTANFALSMAALGIAPIYLTGDEQTLARPVAPLLDVLSSFGARITSNKGMLPARVEGPMDGGAARVDGSTSQYLSSLLIHLPLAPRDSQLTVPSLNEKPYADMTLRWLDDMEIEYEREGYELFRVRGRQSYRCFTRLVPGDFSSATFFACMGAIPGNSVSIRGLDFDDSQGDKAVFDYLEAMGASVDRGMEDVRVTGGELIGARLDLNATPDALPAMAALAAMAQGTTEIVNVPQARIKETDRIAVMAEELAKMGVDIEERPDGLVIRGGGIKGAKVRSHGDHRVVMSLALAASRADGPVTIQAAEAVDITFPNFADLYRQCGGLLEIEND